MWKLSKLLTRLISYQRSEWASPPSLSCLCDHHRACPSASEESRKRSDDGEETWRGNTNMAAGWFYCDRWGYARTIQTGEQCRTKTQSFDCIHICLSGFDNQTQKRTRRNKNPLHLFIYLFFTWNASCEENESDFFCDLGHDPVNASGPCPVAAAHDPVMLSENAVSLQKERKFKKMRASLEIAKQCSVLNKNVYL